MQHKPLLKFLTPNLILASVYALLGIISLELAIPPGYATAIFPPAGISIVALLSGGSRLLPGVWLGSVSINLWAAISHNSLNSSSLLLAMTIAIGVSLQAYVAASLITKFTNINWKSLSRWQDIILFLLLTGPIACLVSASWGVTSLYLFEHISSSELFLNWSNWWLGDLTGVILFAPLSLIILLRHQPLWHNRLIFIAIPIIAATLSLILVFAYSKNNEHDLAENHLQEIGDLIANKIERDMANYQGSVQSLANFIRLYPKLSYTEFNRFTQPIFTQYPNLHALSWNPYVENHDKKSFELQLSKQLGIANLQITKKNMQGELVSSGNKERYLPVAYISPLAKNEKAIAYDISSNTERNNAVIYAQKSGQASITGPITLAQETENSSGLLLLIPVNALSTKNTEQKTLGFAVGVLRIEKILQNVLQQHPPKGVFFSLEDKNSPSSYNLLYSNVPTLYRLNKDTITWQSNIFFAGRVWRLSAYASPRYLSSIDSISILELFFVTLISFALLQVLLFVITGRNHANLEKIKQQNIGIKEAEERWKFALSGADNGVWDWDLLTGKIFFSARYKSMLGFSEEEILNTLENWKNRIHPDDKQRTQLALETYFSGESDTYKNEHRLLCKDGTYKWILACGKVVSWTADKKPIRMLGTHTDISLRKQVEKKHNEAMQLLNYVINSSPDLIFVKDTEKRTILCNRAYATAVGKLPEEMYGYTDLENGWSPEFVHGNPEKSIRGFDTDDNDALAGIVIHNPADPANVEGITRYFDTIKTPLRDNNNKIIGLVGIARDVTERQLMNEKLQLSAKVFHETTEGITITNPDGLIHDVNPAFCKITGYSREEVIGKNPSILSSGKQGPTFYQDMWQALNTYGYWQGEVWNRKKNGMLYAELLSISSVLDKSGAVLHYIGIFTDITHSKKQQATLEQMAHYDVLTKLPNRVLLADRFTQALAHCKRKENLLAICFLDLDNFKPVNDIYGHDTGDQLLVEVARRIQTIIREEDTVSRQGGDEFALLLSDIESSEQCEQMLKRIIESLEEPYIVDDNSLAISASIGVTLFPNDDSDFDTLMRHADQAMYQAKLLGRNQFHLFNAQQDQIDTKKQIKIQEIRKALFNNELRLYYQPKVNMKTGKVFGAEALIRWIHPEKGLIPPLDFLPIIEETELEIEIGNWVIHQALEQLNKWHAQGIKLEVSVNISSFHLQNKAFANHLESALALYPELHSKYLQLEILESSALGDLQAVSTIIKTCIHGLGVSVALDDFGTGYSSLTHLRNLPAKTIKIDQTFVRDALDDPSDLAIIDSVIGLADSFNREVIAEGVESTDHGLLLIMMGCIEAQGYEISKPLPVAEFEPWLTNYTPNQAWIKCAKENNSSRENKIKVFELSLAQWQQSFSNSLNSAPGSLQQWPILKRKKCHCGIWITRAKQEQFYKADWINTLENAHNKMHDIADELFNQYHEGELDDTKASLKDLNLAAEEIKALLQTV